MVLSSGPVSPYEASFMSVLYVTAWLSVHGKSSQKAVCKLGRSCDIRNYAILNAVFTAVLNVVFTPFFM